jgi:hypothetical protein
VTPAIKKVSMMWKHPSPAPAKKVKATPSVRKIMATVFWDHKGALFMDFVDRSDTVTVEGEGSTLEKLWQAI